MLRLKFAYVVLVTLLLGMTFISFMSVAADSGGSSGTQTSTPTTGTNTNTKENTTDNGIPDQIETEQQRSVQVQLDNSSNQAEFQSV